MNDAALQTLWTALEAEPWAHDFFALMRRIETLQPQSPRIGDAARPSQEAVRLGQDAELDFAPAALSSFERRAAVPRIGVRFFGLLGPQGPMPLHLTEYVRERGRQRGDATAGRFLDVFHHRMLTLFYRAWAGTQPTVQRDRPAEDRYAAWLGSAIGLGAGAGAGAAGGSAIPEAARLHQAGLLASRSRHPEGLEKLLTHFFRVPVRVRSHQPHWMPIAPEDRSRLGFAANRRERIGLPRLALGAGVNPGSKVWDRSSRFRIEVGPLDLDRYLGFLPGGLAWRQLGEWVCLYAGPGRGWDVRLCLRGEAVPEPRLGRHVRLGLTAWAGRSSPVDRRDLRLRPSSSGASHA